MHEVVASLISIDVLVAARPATPRRNGCIGVVIILVAIFSAGF